MDQLDDVILRANNIIACSLIFLSTAILTTFPGWHEEKDDNGSERDVKPFPSRSMSILAAALQTFGFLLSLVAMVWQHCSAISYAVSIERFTGGTIIGRVGLTAITIGWTGCVLALTVSVGLVIMILSIALLDSLGEETPLQPRQDDGDE